MRGKCVRQRIKQKSVVLRSPQYRLYHACEHSTRKNRADSCTHCLHARWIMGGAGVGLVCALTEWSYIFLFWLLTTLGFYLVGLRRMAGGAWRGEKIFRKAAERIDSIHKMHHTWQNRGQQSERSEDDGRRKTETEARHTACVRAVAERNESRLSCYFAKNLPFYYI